MTVYVCFMGWLRLVGSWKLQVSFAKEPYKRDDILRKRPMILRSLLIVATPYRSHITRTQTRHHLPSHTHMDTNTSSTHTLAHAHVHTHIPNTHPTVIPQYHHIVAVLSISLTHTHTLTRTHTHMDTNTSSKHTTYTPHSDSDTS